MNPLIRLCFFFFLTIGLDNHRDIFANNCHVTFAGKSDGASVFQLFCSLKHMTERFASFWVMVSSSFTTTLSGVIYCCSKLDIFSFLAILCKFFNFLICSSNKLFLWCHLMAMVHGCQLRIQFQEIECSLRTPYQNRDVF